MPAMVFIEMVSALDDRLVARVKFPIITEFVVMRRFILLSFNGVTIRASSVSASVSACVANSAMPATVSLAGDEEPPPPDPCWDSITPPFIGQSSR